MQTGGNVPRITGLNAFGQPFRGRQIHGVGKAERDVGYAYGREQTSMNGPLASRGGNQAQFAERKLAEAEEAGETHRNRMDEEAAERGREKAKAAAGMAPKKREGMLVSGPGGSAVWKTGEELDRAERGKARAEARKQMGTPGSKNFVGPVPSREMQEAKQAADRAFARWRVRREAAGTDPISTSLQHWRQRRAAR